jgi:hypothetical protein
MNAELIERTHRSLEISLERMPRYADHIRYRRKKINLASCYDTLARDHLKVGIYAYFIEGNLRSFKQNLHVASQLELVSIALNSYQRFQTATDLHFALLSDSPEVIDAMAQLETPEFLSYRNNPLNNQFQVHMRQLALLGDYDALQAKIQKLAQHGRKADRQPAAEGKDFFSLLIRGDKEGLEDLILKGCRKRTGNPLVEDFIAEGSTYRTKLCWYKGIPVQIDHPLVPMALMPIEPLEHYDDVYDFLQPGWVPPPQGLIDKALRWFKKSA